MTAPVQKYRGFFIFSMRQYFSFSSFSIPATSWTYLLLLLLALAHLPFIKADADLELSWSRGAWTDEGLHTCQVRNYLQHDDHSLDKSDNLIKTPLFGALLYGSYSLFGISLTVSRLTVLVLSLCMLFMIARINHYTNGWIILSLPVTFLQFYIFQYSHLALAEILSSICILAGIVFFYRALAEESHRLFYNLLSAVCLSMSYYLKIQYAYIVLLIPMYLFVNILYRYLTEKKWPVDRLKLLGTQIGTYGVLALVYALAWYLPHKALYDYIMADQTGDRYVTWPELMPLLDYYYHTIFLHADLKPFTYLFFLSVILGCLLLFFKGTSQHFKLLFALLLGWMVLELHKLPMSYLPSRYLVSTYIAMGSISALVCRECMYRVLEKNNWTKLFLLISLAACAFILFINIDHYKQTFHRRAFSMAAINDALKNIPLDNRPIVGPWAPGLSWGVNGYSFPVWYNYFNDKDLIKKYHPKVIVSELDEADSGSAFKNNGIHLDSLAQEIRYYKVARWEIKVVILK
jgi:hypothetical protein